MLNISFFDTVRSPTIKYIKTLFNVQEFAIEGINESVTRTQNHLEDIESEIVNFKALTFDEISRIDASVINQINQLNAHIRELSSLNDEVDKLKNDVKILLDIKSKRESNEPWISLDGGDIDPNKGIELKLDWNDAFIDQLRVQGYRGVSETELVSQYLSELSKLIADRERDTALHTDI